ncbi:hypothetical protein [uncultured Clostridium sp.]|jgi:ABC-type nitrate/sulfonate/bicarbonate transport system substrate-binding protein|uniref:ABC transporter substrate-binding protein n=1 Tax=uncultured Clostridium sp. TaxID=59620 RepID=UPI00261226B1|nr:hypothetical protein [uncultured Clostridium sp.]
MKLHIIKKNPLSVSVIMADKLGIFKKNGINVDLTVQEDFKFAGENPYISGKSDAIMGDLTFFFYFLEKGKKSVLTSNLTRTIHLIARKGLSQKRDGLVVGASRAGMLKLFLENDLKDVLINTKIVWINNTYDRIEAFNKGEIDALVAIEPFIDELKEQGGEIIYSTRESKEKMVMWCFDEKFYNENEEKVRLFHKSLEEAQKLFNNMTEEGKYNVGKDIIKYDEISAQRLKKFVFEKSSSVRKEDFDKCVKWMNKNREITKLYDSDKLIKEIF